MKNNSGYEVINFTLNDIEYQGFIKITKKHLHIIECKKDVQCRPLDRIKLKYTKELLTVQKVIIYNTRAELHCIFDDKEELAKSIKTKRKLKKAEGVNKDGDTQ